MPTCSRRVGVSQKLGPIFRTFRKKHIIRRMTMLQTAAYVIQRIGENKFHLPIQMQPDTNLVLLYQIISITSQIEHKKANIMTGLIISVLSTSLRAEHAADYLSFTTPFSSVYWAPATLLACSAGFTAFFLFSVVCIYIVSLCSNVGHLYPVWLKVSRRREHQGLVHIG